MTPNEKTIHKFYTAFANADTEIMFSCYDSIIRFRDPIFGLLHGKDVLCMWSMLAEKSQGNLKIELSNVKADNFLGSATWIATYNYGPRKRKVINKIYANFHFKDGLIIKHTDDFDIWKWATQALGLKGFLFGWTGFMQKKIHENALISLKKYKKTHFDTKHSNSTL
ncbi:nuclear transport factor 2 family protein [Flavobacterium sp. NG2]|uniref:nuclear transport factor 2 family protein n=1 Tax=Flavobacterium sp. NG2 TaxID=3097547 RepID=UPI002A808AD1|nr:nuclear transport factor 2 family protein [Flavobacterium sp. NG2]WPR70697.1 nuclear transport factor 2 family protein [Flavobacterium sp. NG2]